MYSRLHRPEGGGCNNRSTRTLPLLRCSVSCKCARMSPPSRRKTKIKNNSVCSVSEPMSMCLSVFLEALRLLISLSGGRGCSNGTCGPWLCVLYTEQPAWQFKAAPVLYGGVSERRHESSTQRHVQSKDHRVKRRGRRTNINKSNTPRFAKSSAPTCPGLLMAWAQQTSRGNERTAVSLIQQ